VERALNLFEDMSGRQLYPTDITFNVLIHACAKRPDYYDEAFSLLHQMEDIHGFQPDLVTYNTLLGACARKKDLENARNIFRNILQAEHMHPDRWSFTNLFWCYANYDPPATNKKALPESPITTSPSSLVADTTDLIIPKDLPTRRSAVVDEAMSVFDYMVGQQQSPIEMTPALLTAYLNAHVTQYPTQHCTTIYDTLFSNYNISPDAYTFKAMLRYCYQTKDTDLAWRIWDDYQAFLEARALPLTYSDMTIIEQKKAKLEQQERQVKEGWTQAHQRLLVIIMASVLAR
jgi:pentatricopeptide repeat protein